MLGYGMQARQITPAIVREVASDFRLEQVAAVPVIPSSNNNTEGSEGPTMGLKLLHRKTREEVGLSSANSAQKTHVQSGMKSE
jgi:hypothetical protein